MPRQTWFGAGAFMVAMVAIVGLFLFAYFTWNAARDSEVDQHEQRKVDAAMESAERFKDFPDRREPWEPPTVDRLGDGLKLVGS